MSETKIVLNETPGSDVVIRTGEAKPNFKIRKPIEIVGNIDVPAQHLMKQTSTQILENMEQNFSIECIDDVIDESYLLVNRDDISITFVENAGKDHQSTYKGQLRFSPDFLKFGINDMAKQYAPIELSNLLNMNRSFFESKAIAMQLVGTLRNFEAKIDKDIETKGDSRANRRVLRAQAVTTNLPESFELILPIFKGQERTGITVEIDIDPDTLNCRLVCPSVNDYMNEVKNDVIDEQLDVIREAHPNLRIFEI